MTFTQSRLRRRRPTQDSVGGLWPVCTLLLVVAWSVTGCGDDDASGNATIDDLVTAVCKAKRGCCERAGMDNPSLDDCEADAMEGASLSAIQAGTLVIREPQLTQCVAAYRDQAQTCEIGPNVNVCSMAILGTVAPGGACSVAPECAPAELPVVCWKAVTGDTTNEVGVCRELTRAQLGDACVKSGSGPNLGEVRGDESLAPHAYCDTADGLYCKGGTDPVCAMIAATGAACTGSECAPEDYCDDTCKPRVAEGEPCPSPLACESGLLCLAGTCKVLTYADLNLCGGP